MTLEEKILKGHKRQVWLANILAKVGYNTPIGKLLRLWVYYADGIVILRHWRDFLSIRQKNIGDQYLAVDQAIMHSSYSQVRELMHGEPQIRGNDLGIIRILAPSYLLNNPLSLGTNGEEHTGVRALFIQALPNPLEVCDFLGALVNECLMVAVQKGELHVGNDLPAMMIQILHQVVFDITLTDEEVEASRKFIKSLPLASLPNFISEKVIFPLTAPIIKHRQKLIQKYQRSPKWFSYLETGFSHGLNEHQIANSLFDMIHIAGTAGTSALLGSVIGVLCLDNGLRSNVIAEIDRVWDGNDPLQSVNIAQLTLVYQVILETARLYPPVRFVSQLAPDRGEINLGTSKCPFQKGTRLLGSIFTANRDPRKYDNPDDFDITRDLSDILSWNGSGHERACPGRDLSIGIIQIFCLYLFKKYRWDSITEVKWDFEKVTAVTPNNLVLQGFSCK
ncbi:cytochrome P450 [Calothrix sp. NIES-3974]|uniref:cytochrome P450 n=1 Tax=Calothrix sp. NIES-3974 TaxID=2005462 RepID=UPI000B62303D|nr:cytochrome P450 [Calothrix sp. NIES-3974]BAZ07887.1 cytochrome P450-like protein [Calothrix sp. NIES-3974]